MRKSKIVTVIPAKLELIWNIVTDNTKTEWRSDLSKVEIINDEEFVEYTTKGVGTKFRITKKADQSYYEFSFGNENMSGRWIGKFKSTGKNETELEFTEEIEIKSRVMELLSYIFFPIKKIQKTYMEDLKREAVGAGKNNLGET